MNRKGNKLTLPKRLQNVSSARDLFAYFLGKAALMPEICMSPEKGDLRRVVLFSSAITDKMVDMMELMPDLESTISSMEEVRLVATKVSTKGVARMRNLMPNIKIRVVDVEEWEQNIDTTNPDIDL